VRVTNFQAAGVHLSALCYVWRRAGHHSVLREPWKFIIASAVQWFRQFAWNQ